MYLYEFYYEVICLLKILSDLLNSEMIFKYKVLTEFTYDNKFFSTIFNNDYNDLQDISSNSLYILNLKTFDVAKDNIINTVTKLSDKEITLILYNDNGNIIIDKNITKIFIQYGNKYKISIIYIISNKPVLEITNLLLMQVNQSHLNELTQTREIYNKFSYFSLKELGLEAIINYFKKSIGNPVAVFDIDSKCIASTDKYLDKYFEIKSSAVRKNCYNLYYLTQKVCICKDDIEQEITQIFFPINIHKNAKAYVCVFETEKTLKDIDYFSLEVAATATLIEMKKRIAMKTAEERFVNNLIYDLINNKIDDEGILLERSELIGLNVNEKYLVILLEITNPSKIKLKNKSLKFEDINDKIFTLASRKIFHKNPYCKVAKLSNTVITLWPLGKQDVHINLTCIKDVYGNIQKEIIQEYKDISIVVGIGKPVDNLKLIYKSYREAKDAIILGATNYSKNAIISFKDLGVLRLISKVEDRNSLLEIIPEGLVDLKRYDDKNNTQLLETLRVYLECNGNASKAAQVLYVHYKTILYRLEKVNKVCNINLDDYYDRLEVEIGLKLIKTLHYDNIPIK